jgi:hypothetical protein
MEHGGGGSQSRRTGDEVGRRKALERHWDVGGPFWGQRGGVAHHRRLPAVARSGRRETPAAGLRSGGGVRLAAQERAVRRRGARRRGGWAGGGLERLVAGGGLGAAGADGVGFGGGP